MRPLQNWEKEFSSAQSAGYDYIELISERDHNKTNPLWSDEGIEKIKDLILFVKHFGVEVKKRPKTPKDMASLIRAFEGNIGELAMKRVLLRSMGKAEYSRTAKLHFGLGTSKYASARAQRMPWTAASASVCSGPGAGSGQAKLEGSASSRPRCGPRRLHRRFARPAVAQDIGT